MEVLGLPEDVLNELLDCIVHKHGCQVSQRFCLASKHLLSWIDAKQTFWEALYRQTGHQVHEFPLILSIDSLAKRMKQRFVLSYTSVRNLASSTFNGAYVLQEGARRAASKVTMQDGSKNFIVDYLNVIGGSERSEFVNLDHWPLLAVSKIEPPRNHSNILGNFAAETSNVQEGEIPSVSRSKIDAGNPATTKEIFKLRYRPPNITFDDLRYYQIIPSSNARFERVAFFGPQTRPDGVKCSSFIFYDFETNNWSDAMELGHGLTDYPINVVFSGSHFAAVSVRKRLWVIRCDSFSTSLTLIYDGTAPSECQGSPVIALAEKHLLLYYLAPYTHRTQGAKLLKILFDNLSLDMSEIDSVKADSAGDVLWLPLWSLHAAQCSMRAFASSTIIFCRAGAVFIDLNSHKFIRTFNCSDEILNIRFVDSTMFLINTYRFNYLVDLCQRRDNDPVTHKTFQMLLVDTKGLQPPVIKICRREKWKQFIHNRLTQPLFAFALSTDGSAENQEFVFWTETAPLSSRDKQKSRKIIDKIDESILVPAVAFHDMESENSFSCSRVRSVKGPDRRKSPKDDQQDLSSHDVVYLKLPRDDNDNEEIELQISDSLVAAICKKVKSQQESMNMKASSRSNKK